MLTTEMEPPIEFASSCEIANPNPLPFFQSAVYALVKICILSFSEIPAP